MPITLANAQTLLGAYAGVGNTAGNAFNIRLNFVRQRLLQAGNWTSTKTQVLFAAYPDANQQGFITLPREYQSVLAIAHYPQGGTWCTGRPLRTRGLWYEFAQGGAGFSRNQVWHWRRGLVPIQSYFTTFQDWSTPVTLQIQFETTESTGLIVFRGTLGGQKIYSVINGTWQEGCPLGWNSPGSTVTTTQTFDVPPYAIIKPVTNGRVFLYTVAGTVKTLVGIMEPAETLVQWKRYKIPVCCEWNAANPGYYVAICKYAFIPSFDGFDTVIPGNVGALRFGLQALLCEDARDRPGAKELWNDAFELLRNEVTDDEGAGAEDVIQMADDFHIEQISYGV